MALLEQALRLCVFSPGKLFAASIFCPDPRGAVARFCDRFPCYQPHAEKNVAVPAAPWHVETLAEVEFHLLPGAVSDLPEDSSALLDAAPGDRVHVVAAFDDGPGSVALISAIAPRIGRIANERGFHAMAYYYFNSPDSKYRAVLERSHDASIPGVGIRAFTDFLDGCTVAAVEARPFDDLARLLNFHCAAPESQGALGGRASMEAAAELWESSTTEEDRQFSRSAADHMAVKVRALGISWQSLLDRDKG